jgi:outer membrane protein, heavy metal efflux system
LATGGRERLTEYSALVGQPLEWPAMRAARQRAAESGVAGATVGVVETRLNLTADVKVAFYNLLLAQREQELAKQNLVIVEDVRRIVQTRVKLGEAPQFELIKAEVEVLKANQVVKRTENAVRVNRVVLDTLTAGSLGPAYAIQGDFDAYPKGLKVEPLLTRALDDHPTVQRLTRFVQRAEHGIEFQRQARVPNVTVNGGYYREIGREAYLAGISVPTPIWYQRQGEVAEALGVKRRDEAELLRAKNILVKEVNQHWQDARTTSELLTVFEKGLLGQAQEALRIAQFSFLQGAASLLEVLDAQRVQRQILLDYNQARYDLSVSLARLERASGGVLY